MIKVCVQTLTHKPLPNLPKSELWQCQINEKNCFCLLAPR
uniref:Uncharacterized protein n=1 Tax=Anguilla anguilla TaxID=7936 RepID=A0A0E9W3W0_ANGAN